MRIPQSDFADGEKRDHKKAKQQPILLQQRKSHLIEALVKDLIEESNF